jgi:hypothetical protein
MPTQSSPRQMAPRARKETLAAVKCRLVRDLAQRTQNRVRYWQRREKWCISKPGRVLVIGWDSVEKTLAMPTYYSHSEKEPSAMNETLSDVKDRLVRELAQITQNRSRFAMRRDEWDPVIARTNIAEQTAIAQAIATGTCPKGSAKALWHFSSCVEIPD